MLGLVARCQGLRGQIALPPGEDYNPTIINNVRNSDLFVFLISPESMAEGKYSRSELRFAREVWEAKRLRELEAENARLKKLLAETIPGRSSATGNNTITLHARTARYCILIVYRPFTPRCTIKICRHCSASSDEYLISSALQTENRIAAT